MFMIVFVCVVCWVGNCVLGWMMCFSSMLLVVLRYCRGYSGLRIVWLSEGIVRGGVLS